MVQHALDRLCIYRQTLRFNILIRKFEQKAK
jgi:hypothetical protein